jgi:hypothetical protein
MELEVCMELEVWGGCHVQWKGLRERDNKSKGPLTLNLKLDAWLNVWTFWSQNTHKNVDVQLSVWCLTESNENKELQESWKVTPTTIIL